MLLPQRIGKTVQIRCGPAAVTRNDCSHNATVVSKPREGAGDRELGARRPAQMPFYEVVVPSGNRELLRLGLAFETRGWVAVCVPACALDLGRAQRDGIPCASSSCCAVG